jgi:hypothetical protein
VLHQIARRHRVGEISPRADQWAGLSDSAETPDGPLRYVIRRAAGGEIDGIARYRLPWSPNVAEAGVLVVEGLEAVTDEAFRALWELLLDFDLTRRVVAVARPADEPVRWMLKNPRAMRVTRQTDNFWVRLLDVPAALEARGYEADGSLIFEITQDAMCPANVGIWRLSVTGGLASCTPAAGMAMDLTVDVQALGSLYLGGMSASLLASAGQVRQHRDGAIGLLSRLLRTDPAPFNAIGFLGSLIKPADCSRGSPAVHPGRGPRARRPARPPWRSRRSGGSPARGMRAWCRGRRTRGLRRFCPRPPRGPWTARPASAARTPRRRQGNSRWSCIPAAGHGHRREAGAAAGPRPGDLRRR